MPNKAKDGVPLEHNPEERAILAKYLKSTSTKEFREQYWGDFEPRAESAEEEKKIDVEWEMTIDELKEEIEKKRKLLQVYLLEEEEIVSKASLLEDELEVRTEDE